jgi:hypothetical protein
MGCGGGPPGTTAKQVSALRHNKQEWHLDPHLAGHRALLQQRLHWWCLAAEAVQAQGGVEAPLEVHQASGGATEATRHSVVGAARCELALEVRAALPQWQLHLGEDAL